MPTSVPLRDSILDPAKPGQKPTGSVSWSWLNYFLKLTTRVGETARRLRHISLTAQAAAIGTTPVPLGALAAGLYRVTWYARITQAATTSSSLTVTIAFTSGGIACAFNGAALTGNTTSTVQTGSVVVRIDAATPLTYAVAYASVGGAPMLYAINLIVEEVVTT